MPLTPAPSPGAVEPGPDERVNILVVDDLQEKLLVFKTVLDELQQNLVFVRSGAEALREVLRREFAVILLDVNMPDIDGFETATLIRRYKRSAHTPIIFVTSYADEAQTTRGYSLGAVDFIQSPVVPAILRSKVRVFVELHVLQRRIARQADERVALAASAAALEVAEESMRRAAYLSELSAALSGLTEVRTTVHRLLWMVVPRLARSATVVVVDEGQRVKQVVTRRGAEGEALDRGFEDLDLETRERLQMVLEAPAALATSLARRDRAYPLRHGDRSLGVLLIDGEPTQLGGALLDEVAARAAIALATAQLYHSLQDEINERRQAEIRLEQSSRRKDEFLAMLSHELRNPLAPIRNAVEVIRRIAGQNAQLMRATEITDRQVRQLARLVDELLDVARISQGKIALQKTAINLSALVLECIEAQRPFIETRRQSLVQSMSPAPVWVEGDTARIQQVVNNLLNNAVKYTQDKGSLHVTVGVEQDLAVLRVRDNGMGIDAELLPRVFDLFEQGTRSLDRSQGGLGVGLTLVQRLVHLHQGRVEALSEGVGRGAEFVIRLPCLRDSTTPSVAAAPAQASTTVQRRVLLVEDNADVAETTALMLTMSGHEVRVAQDGLQALVDAARFEPEIVLLDIGLPELDGYEVARRLRQLPQTQGAFLVALTGYGQLADRQRGVECGFDHHLLKPVDPETLMTLIAGWSPAPRADSAVPAEAPQSTAQLYAFRRT